MISFAVKWVMKKLAASLLSRYITVGVVALLLGGGALKWHSHKEGLREEGIQECVQEINKATVKALEDALADAESANAALSASLIAAAAVNQEALARRAAVEASLQTLQKQMEQQKNEDPAYREWSDAALPDGVVSRLRKAARGPSGNTD